MKVDLSAPGITTFRSLLERLVREEVSKRMPRRRAGNKDLPPPAESLEAQK